MIRSRAELSSWRGSSRQRPAQYTAATTSKGTRGGGGVIRNTLEFTQTAARQLSKMVRTASLCVALATAAAFMSATESGVLVRIVQITDTHIGEGCEGELSYEACKPTRALTDAVRKINLLDPRPTAVLLTGDITSSALMPEFEAANTIMSALEVPWMPILGNHDSWPYQRNADNSFSQTETPIGDQYFAQVFGERLKEGSKGAAGAVSVSGWPTSTCLNGNFGFQTWHHNFVLSFPALPTLKVLALDFTARGNALPEPGVGPEAELHDYPCGTLPWLDTQLRGFAADPSTNATESSTTTKSKMRFFVAQHHPYHNRGQGKIPCVTFFFLVVCLSFSLTFFFRPLRISPPSLPLPLFPSLLLNFSHPSEAFSPFGKNEVSVSSHTPLSSFSARVYRLVCWISVTSSPPTTQVSL